MTIGQVAKRTSLNASAIRYYERAGLLPRAARVGGQRRDDGRILDSIAVLERAKSCGFTIAEMKALFNDEDTHSAKWRRLAIKKIADLDAAVQRIAAVREILQRGCECTTATECGRCIRQSEAGC